MWLPPQSSILIVVRLDFMNYVSWYSIKFPINPINMKILNKHQMRKSRHPRKTISVRYHNYMSTLRGQCKSILPNLIKDNFWFWSREVVKPLRFFKISLVAPTIVLVANSSFLQKIRANFHVGGGSKFFAIQKFFPYFTGTQTCALIAYEHVSPSQSGNINIAHNYSLIDMTLNEA